MVPFDSLGKLADLIPTENYNILIDEYHCLFTSYSFRRDACQTILKNYKRFRNFTFMTATPIKNIYLLNELKGIPVLNAKWDNVDDVKITPIDCTNSVAKTVKSQIKKFLDGRLDGNAYFFVNSLKFINQMIVACGLTNENTRVIYSDHNDTILKNGIKRGKTIDNPTRINFITSTAFEGCDIYDTEGVTIIVSDPIKEHTLIDIKTQAPQIIGRLRDSKYKTEVFHIYRHTEKDNESNLSEGEYAALAEKRLKGAIDYVEDYKSSSPRIKATIEGCVRNNNLHDVEGTEYLNIDNDGQVILDENLYYIDLYNYEIANVTYSTRIAIEEGYNDVNIKVNEWQTDSSNLILIAAGSFKGLKEVYNFLEGINAKKEIGDKLSLKDRQLEAECFEMYSWLKEIIERFGLEFIKSNNYEISNIKRKLEASRVSNNPEDVKKRIFESLIKKGLFKKGAFISNTVAEQSLKNAYMDAGLGGIEVKPAVISNYFITTKHRINSSRGYIILGSRFRGDIS